MSKCRLCYCNLNADQEFCENIFNGKFDPPIWKIIAELANLTIMESDPYTKIVCFQCFDQLQQFYLFRKVVLYTDWRIRHFDEHNNNINDIERSVENADNNLNDCPSIKTEKNQTDRENYISKDGHGSSSKPIIDDQNGISAPQELKDKGDVNVNGIHDNSRHTYKNNNHNNNREQQSLIDMNNSFNDCHEYCPPVEAEMDDYAELVEEKIKVEEYSLKMENESDNDSHTYKHNDDDDDDGIIIGDQNGTNSFETLTTCILYNNGTETEINENQESINPSRIYMCNICDSEFSNKNDIKIHLKLHTGEKPYKCHICDKQFPHESNLKVHLRVHTGERPYECKFCERKFAYQSNLTHHLRVHTGEKPHKCHICDKEFARKSNLKVHFRMHTGEKPYKCNICDKQFAKKKSLSVHLELH